VLPPNGQGTVVASGNAFDGLEIFDTPGAPLSTVSGLVAWGNATAGMRVFGGSAVKVRNSLFLGNTTYGILVSSDAATSDGNNLGTIDLGKSAASDPGGNYLQLPASATGTNTQGGICVNLNNCTGSCPAPLTENLAAEGNYLVSTTGTLVNCASSTTAITKGNCTNGHSDGIAASTGITVTVDVAGCM